MVTMTFHVLQQGASCNMCHLCVSSGFVQCDVAKFIVFQQNCQYCRITYPVIIWMLYVVLSNGNKFSKYHPWFHFSISLTLLQYSIWGWMWNWAGIGIREDSGDKVGFGNVSKFNRLFTVPIFSLACVSSETHNLQAVFLRIRIQKCGWGPRRS